jgi:hypothetical protein
MTNEKLREKLENADLCTIAELWEEYCNQELPDKFDMIDDLMNYVTEDSDLSTFEYLASQVEQLENEVS